jgi:hypothetical protein
MGRMARACAGILIVIAGSTAVLTGTASASGVRCEEKVLTDWSDNGRVDGMYPLHCYQAAIQTMPTDLRDYTNATDAIQRALARAATRTENGQIRRRRLAANSNARVAAPAASNIPLPLLALVAVSLTVLAAGGTGWAARRRRTRHQS